MKSLVLVLLLQAILLSMSIGSNSNENLYDFIVVGSGSAGGIIAPRLAQNEKKVLLIEAGPNDLDVTCTHCGFANEVEFFPPGGVVVPELHLDIGQIRQAAWPAFSEPAWEVSREWSIFDQLFNLEDLISDHSALILRGKLLGGCGSHNEMSYCRGTREYYDSLASIHGLNDFAFNKHLKILKRLENYTLVGIENEFHGYDGPIQMTPPTYREKMLDEILNSISNMGIEIVEDIFADNYDGWGVNPRNIGTYYGHNQKNALGGRTYRSAPPENYIRPTLKRYGQYLTVLVNSEVKKIIFSEANGASSRRGESSKRTAIGVEYFDSNDNTTKQAFVKKNGEVIISGGVYQSPKLLLVSGIGPKHDLEKLGIDVVYDSKYVGKNLQDHIFLYLTFNIKPEFLTEEWLSKSLSPELDDINTEIMGFLKNNDRVTDMVIFSRITNKFRTNDLRSLLTNDPNDVRSSISGIKYTDLMVQFAIIYQRAPAFGSVKLNPESPSDYPKVFLDPLQDEIVIEGFLKAIKFIRDVVDGLPDGMLSESHPGPQMTSREDLINGFIKKYTWNALHGTSTVSMSDTHRDYPLDKKFRVRGVKNLRVCDASSFPIIPDCYPNVGIMGIGELCAETLLKKKQSSH